MDKYIWLANSNDEYGDIYIDPFEEPTDPEASIAFIKLSSGEFQVSFMGKFYPFLAGPGYFLARKDIIDFLFPYVPDQLSYKPAIIFRKITNEYWYNYYEVKTKESFTPEQYENMYSDLDDIQTCEGKLFVTKCLLDQIKDDLLALEPTMKFHDALPNYIGGR